ncbi:MAG: radical SAM protein [Phycisphaerae bacterium]
MAYIYGPVPSRRLGRSLGVDLVPFKTCSYDCIYCQLGRTTNKTVEQREWFPLDDVLTELKDNLATAPDYITLSGSGEPTLYSRLGELVDGIRSMTDVPVALLTNGSLLWRKDLREQLMGLDLVVPTLDAGNSRMFKLINRPHRSISFEQMLEGLITFRREFSGSYWLEVFILAGHNAEEAEVREIVECTDRIRPDLVQLNTATRPPAEEYAVMADRHVMHEVAARFDPPADVIADYKAGHGQSELVSNRDTVLEMIRRRPCSTDDIASGLGLHRNEVLKYLDELDAAGLLRKQRSGGRTFYSGRHDSAKDDY